MRRPRSRQLPIFRDERRKDTFRQKPLCSSDVLSATQRTATSGKNYWAILRGTGIPESIRAIGVSYSSLATERGAASDGRVEGGQAMTLVFRKQRAQDRIKGRDSFDWGEAD